MIRLQTYAGLSLVATVVVIYHAFSTREQLYPAMVYLSTSKVNLVLLLNMGLVAMCILWQLTKRVFLGSLREAEVERLNEQSWREVMEILFAITMFRQDFFVSFLAMVTALLLIKALHWLAQKRVEYIETTPTVPKLSHLRIVSFMVFLLVLDSVFLYNSVMHLVQTREASVSLFFAFEYMILATTTVSTIIKYVFYVYDLLKEGQWERKAVYTFYLELIRDLLHLSMYMCFFLVIFLNYSVPLHLIRELYETFRSFQVRVADYLRYRKITSNMNDRFPDATPDELNASDATCIICREEMTVAKKLACGHMFHVHCLRSWLERQHTCPTCRANVIPTESGTTTSGTQADIHQQGASSASTSSQSPSGDGVVNGNIEQHQTRAQAAASAASIYQKSYVYPSPSTLVCCYKPMKKKHIISFADVEATLLSWSPGYALPQGFKHLANSLDKDSVGESQQQCANCGRPTNVSFSQFPFSNDLMVSASQLEAQEKLIEHQIEGLQIQLQLLQNHASDKCSSMETVSEANSDSKRKVVLTSSSSFISDCDPREKTDERAKETAPA